MSAKVEHTTLPWHSNKEQHPKLKRLASPCPHPALQAAPHAPMSPPDPALTRGSVTGEEQHLLQVLLLQITRPIAVKKAAAVLQGQPRTYNGGRVRGRKGQGLRGARGSKVEEVVAVPQGQPGLVKERGSGMGRVRGGKGEWRDGSGEGRGKWGKVEEAIAMPRGQPRVCKGGRVRAGSALEVEVVGRSKWEEGQRCMEQCCRGLEVIGSMNWRGGQGAD